MNFFQKLVLKAVTIFSILIWFLSIPQVSAHFATDIKHFVTFDFQQDKLEIKYQLAPDTFTFDQFMVYCDTNDNGVIDESEAREIIQKYVVPNIEITLNNQKITPHLDAVEIGKEEIYYTGDPMITAYLTIRHVDFANENLFQATVTPALFDFPTQTTTFQDNLKENFYFTQIKRDEEKEQDNIYRTEFEKKEKVTSTPAVSAYPLSFTDFAQAQIDKIIKGFDPKNPVYLVSALVFAFLAGLVHALTPGHGKSIMTAYLIGTDRQKRKDIFILGTAVTFSHTILIFILGFILLAFSDTFRVSTVFPYFTIFSSLIMLLLAVSLLRQSFLLIKNKGKDVHTHGLISHSHEVEPEAVKKRISEDKLTNWRIFLVGVSGGIIPCAEALSLMIFAARMGQTWFGLLLVFVFSIGLATAIVIIGFLIMKGRSKLSGIEKFSRVFQIVIPAVIGVVILIYAIYSIYATIPLLK